MEKGWNAVTLEEISSILGVPIKDIVQILPGKEQGFSLLAAHVETQVFAKLSSADVEPYSEKERALEVLLTKLETLTPFKPFLKYLRQNFLTLTEISLPFAMAELSSLERILAHYGFAKTSLLSELKRKGLFGIYLLALDTWLQDETHDLGPTSAKLDGLLNRGEIFLERYS